MQDRSEKVELRVRGTAKTQVPPDFAELHVSASFVDPLDRSAALAAAAGAGERLRNAFTALGVDGPVGVEVHLSSVSVRPENRWVDDQLVSEGYRATLSGTVRCAADDAGEVAALVTATEVSLGHVSWLLDDDNPVHRHVRGRAVADAERAADDFADALGRPRGAIVALSDPGLGGGSFGVAPGGWTPRAAAAGAPVDLDLDPSPVTVSASVEAVYWA